LRSTTPWVAVNSRKSSNLLTVISIVAVPVADAIASTGILESPVARCYFEYFSYIKIKTIKTSSNSRRVGKVEISPSRQFYIDLRRQTSCPKSGPRGTDRQATPVPSMQFRPTTAQLPHELHRGCQGRPRFLVKIRAIAAFYPPSCSVILFSSLFKSLSVLRTVSIFSTECKTVV
jgi:hypothetical protein